MQVFIMDVRTLPSTGLLRRMSRALRLDRSLYSEVRSDASATPQAVAIIVLVALAHGAGGILRGLSFGWNPWSGALFGLLGELTFFIVASLVIYAATAYVSDSRATYQEVLRCFGFATTPGLLIVMAAVASLFGTRASAPVFALLVAWRLAAGLMAVHQTGRRSVGKSLIALLIGVAAGLAAVAGAIRGLVIVLDWAGVRS